MTKYASVRDVQNRYGISRSSVYRWIESSEISFPTPIKIGNRVLWRDSDLDSFDARIAAAHSNSLSQGA